MNQLEQWAEEHVRNNLYQYTVAENRSLLVADEAWFYCEEKGLIRRREHNFVGAAIRTAYERLIRDPANWTGAILNHWIRELNIAEKRALLPDLERFI